MIEPKVEMHEPKILTFYAVTKNSDSTEGKGYTIQLGHFANEGQALSCAKDKRYAKYCVMGVHHPDRAHHDVIPVHIKLYDNPEAFFAHHDKLAIRERAIAKLNKEEREALGLA